MIRTLVLSETISTKDNELNPYLNCTKMKNKYLYKKNKNKPNPALNMMKIPIL